MNENPPTQAQFDKDHEYPVPYGEDGDIAVGSNYTEQQAFDKFKEYWIDTDGEVPDWFDPKDMALMSFGWSIHPDYSGDDEPYSYTLIRGSNVTPLFTGWVYLS